MSLAFLLSLSCLLAAILAPSSYASASSASGCSSKSQPLWTAYRNHSVFTALYDQVVLPHTVARVNTSSGQVEQRYVLDAAYVITNLFTSSHYLYSVAFNQNSSSLPKRQDIVVSDIATGRQVRVLLNVSGDVQSSDDAGAVLARANYNTVDLLSAINGSLLHTIDIGKHGLLPAAVQMHPTNGHVYILNQGAWEILEVRSNSSVVSTTPLTDAQPDTFSLDSSARYAYTLQGDGNRPSVLRQFELRTGKAGWSTELSGDPRPAFGPYVAAGEAGEVWTSDGSSASLYRFNSTGNTSLCLDDKVKATADLVRVLRGRRAE